MKRQMTPQRALVCLLCLFVGGTSQHDSHHTHGVSHFLRPRSTSSTLGPELFRTEANQASACSTSTRISRVGEMCREEGDSLDQQVRLPAISCQFGSVCLHGVCKAFGALVDGEACKNGNDTSFHLPYSFLEAGYFCYQGIIRKFRDVDDHCQTDLQCLRGKCSKGRCTTSSEGDKCIPRNYGGGVASECGRGLFCNEDTGLCSQSASVGESCSIDEDNRDKEGACRGGAFCSRSRQYGPLECVREFSLAEGEFCEDVVEFPRRGVSPAINPPTKPSACALGLECVKGACTPSRVNATCGAPTSLPFVHADRGECPPMEYCRALSDEKIIAGPLKYSVKTWEGSKCPALTCSSTAVTSGCQREASTLSDCLTASECHQSVMNSVLSPECAKLNGCGRPNKALACCLLGIGPDNDQTNKLALPLTIGGQYLNCHSDYDDDTSTNTTRNCTTEKTVNGTTIVVETNCTSPNDTRSWADKAREDPVASAHSYIVVRMKLLAFEDVEVFSTSEQNAFRKALADVLKCSITDVTITGIEPGSVIVTSKIVGRDAVNAVVYAEKLKSSISKAEFQIQTGLWIDTTASKVTEVDDGREYLPGYGQKSYVEAQADLEDLNSHLIYGLGGGASFLVIMVVFFAFRNERKKMSKKEERRVEISSKRHALFVHLCEKSLRGGRRNVRSECFNRWKSHCMMYMSPSKKTLLDANSARFRKIEWAIGTLNNNVRSTSLRRWFLQWAGRESKAVLEENGEWVEDHMDGSSAGTPRDPFSPRLPSPLSHSQSLRRGKEKNFVSVPSPRTPRGNESPRKPVAMRSFAREGPSMAAQSYYESVEESKKDKATAEELRKEMLRRAREEASSGAPMSGSSSVVDWIVRQTGVEDQLRSQSPRAVRAANRLVRRMEKERHSVTNTSTARTGGTTESAMSSPRSYTSGGISPRPVGGSGTGAGGGSGGGPYAIDLSSVDDNRPMTSADLASVPRSPKYNPSHPKLTKDISVEVPKTPTDGGGSSLRRPPTIGYISPRRSNFTNREDSSPSPEPQPKASSDSSSVIDKVMKRAPGTSVLGRSYRDEQMSSGRRSKSPTGLSDEGLSAINEGRKSPRAVAIELHQKWLEGRADE